MSSWKIKEVDKLSEEEERAYLEKLESSYKKEIKKLKEGRKDKLSGVFQSLSWRIVMLISTLGIFAGPFMMANGVHIGSAITLGSVFGFAGAPTYSIVADNADLDMDEMKNALKDAKHAKEEINELKKEVKNIEKNPIMAKR